MGKDHPDCDRVVRKIRVSEVKREVHVNIVIELKESLVIELHKRGAGDGFGDGGDDVDGLVGRWFVCFDVREAISFLPDDGGIVDETSGHAWIMTDFE